MVLTERCESNKGLEVGYHETKYSDPTWRFWEEKEVTVCMREKGKKNRKGKIWKGYWGHGYLRDNRY